MWTLGRVAVLAVTMVSFLVCPEPALAVRVVEKDTIVTATWGIAYNQGMRRFTSGGSSVGYLGPFGTGSDAHPGTDLRDMAVAVDGTVWVVEPSANKVWHYGVDLSAHAYPVAGGPSAIAAGPDGNMWITESTGNNIARLTPAGVVTEFPIPTLSSNPSGIALGALDRNLWFTEKDGNNIGRITPAGVITEYPIPSAGASPSAIASDGFTHLAFSEPGVNKIGIFDVVELLVEEEDPIPTANASPQGITLGPDGNFWFVEYLGNNVGKSAYPGSITEYPIPTPASHPRSIARGGDGDLWFTEQSTGKLGRVLFHPSGDVDGNGKIDVSDVFYLINFLFAGGPEPM